MLFGKLKLAATVVLTLGFATGGLVAGRLALVRADDARAGKTDRARDAKADQRLLEGRWEIVSLVDGGREPDEDEAKRIRKQRIVFEGDKLRIRSEATYSIDSGKKPKEIDMTVKEGPKEEIGTWKGIYELKGDELTLCFSPPNADRPTKFASKEGDPLGKVLIRLRRVK